MRIGIVCEGETDLIAIKHFLGLSFATREKTVEFVELQPQPDNTQGAGWSQVFNWISKNPPKIRSRQYFQGGLFASGLSTKQCDAILFQIDADIIGENGFEQWLKKRDLAVSRPSSPSERASFIEVVMKQCIEYDDLDDVQKSKHLLFPAVECTETWCIAAVSGLCANPEVLSLQQLKNHFGWLVADVSGVARKETYSGINKTQATRTRVCSQIGNTAVLEAQCPQYLRYFNLNLAKVFETSEGM